MHYIYISFTLKHHAVYNHRNTDFEILFSVVMNPVQYSSHGEIALSFALHQFALTCRKCE